MLPCFTPHTPIHVHLPGDQAILAIIRATDLPATFAPVSDQAKEACRAQPQEACNSVTCSMAPVRLLRAAAGCYALFTLGHCGTAAVYQHSPGGPRTSYWMTGFRDVV